VAIAFESNFESKRLYHIWTQSQYVMQSEMLSQWSWCCAYIRFRMLE